MKHSAKHEYYYCTFFNRVYRKKGKQTYHVLTKGGWVKYEGLPNLSKTNRISHEEVDSCGATLAIATHANAPAKGGGNRSRNTLRDFGSNRDEMQDLINTGMFFTR